MHELTKNVDAKGRETSIYIDYICAVINLYSSVCLDSNLEVIRHVMRQTGLDESHILCVIANDNERLIIHEKFK